MSTSTILTEEQMTNVEPVDDHMFERAGFDRRNIRYEMAAVNEVEQGVRKVRTEGKAFISPDSDTGVAPTSVGESAGQVDIVQTDGKELDLVRFTNGFTLYDEDRDVDASYLQDMRDTVLEMFDFRGDVVFLDGLTDEDGNVTQKSALQWLKDNVPSTRVIDCSAYSGEPPNVIKEEAYSKVSGEMVDTSWGTMLGKHSALAHFAAYDPNTNSTRSYWEQVQSNGNTVGVQERRTIPDKLSLPAPQGSSERIEVTIDDLGADEVVLLPEQANEMFYNLYENAEPKKFDPVQKDGGREKHEYVWRTGVMFDPEDRAADATDAVILTNVSALF